MAKPSTSLAEPVTRLDLRTEAATVRFAASVAEQARPGDVIGLTGALGLGKTTFARAFIRALTSPAEDVPSPTFTLVQSYESRSGTIYHFDLYRLESPEEAWELGIEEAFAGGISLIEWPERFGPHMPADALWLAFAADRGDPDARQVTLSGGPGWQDRVAILVAGMAGD